VRWLPLSHRSQAHLPRGIGCGEDGDRCSIVDRLSKQFASHEALLETGGTQTREQVEFVEVGDLADEGVQTSCKGHPPRPGTGDGKVLQRALKS
jgi:hypothetical protein